MKHLLSAPYLAFLSLVFGAVLAVLVPITLDAARDEYDRSHPVWVAQSTKVTERTADTVKLAVIGEKTRDCDLLRTWAQSLYPDKPATDAYVMREGGNAVGYINRPVGVQDLGEFVLLGVPTDATSVVVHVEHNCGGRVVLSQLAQAALPTSNR